MTTIKRKDLIPREKFLCQSIEDLQELLSNHEDEQIFISVQDFFQGLVVREDGTIHFAKTEIPHEYFLSIWVIAHTCRNIKKLNLSRQKLSQLPNNFTNLGLLEELNLSHNRFLELPHVLLSLPSLTTLSINANPLRLHTEEFASNIRLDARDVVVEKIPSGVRTLVIYGHQLEALLPSIALSSITSLHIEDYQRMASYKGTLSNIKEFVVYNALIKNLPPILNQCPNLEHLSWENGHLVQWPDNIHLPKLKHLSLRHNRIAWLSGNLKRHRCLQTLDLSHNSLRFIPQSVRACSQIVDLRLSFCQLKHMDTSLRNMTSLEVLDLSGNPLKSIYGELASMNLTCIDIQDTQIEAPQTLSGFVKGYDTEEDQLRTPLVINSDHILKVLKVHHLTTSSNTLPIDELDLTGQSFEDAEEFVHILEQCRPRVLRLWKTKLPAHIPQTCPRPQVIYAETKDFLKLPASWHPLVVPPRFFSVHIESRFRESTFRSLLIQIHPDIFANGYEIPQLISLPHGKEQYYLDLFSENEILLTEIDSI